ncbi:unnamed protein product [Bursaphelenchus xylophilus]|uniref:(pine wood nematode) hypothetical protein n=1 Tax=Bursaphelenchus xylophilus TaxID=6326 RepID=A0A1I7RP99_BURXY|nr:unnamed protein product [Bursaphelenchus xylophilus]CAG9095657.1 unnamed protein product [Bursaphelenchus xylophilus]
MRPVSGLVLISLIVTAYNAEAFRIYKRQDGIESQFRILSQPEEEGLTKQKIAETTVTSIPDDQPETDFSQGLTKQTRREPVADSSSKTPKLDLPLPYPLGYGTRPHDGEHITPGQQQLPMYPHGIMAKLPLAWPIGYGIGPHDGPLELSPEEEAKVRKMLPYPIGSKNGGKHGPLALTTGEERAVLNILPAPVGFGDNGASLGLSSEQIHNIRMKFDEAINESTKLLQNKSDERKSEPSLLDVLAKVNFENPEVGKTPGGNSIKTQTEGIHVLDSRSIQKGLGSEESSSEEELLPKSKETDLNSASDITESKSKDQPNKVKQTDGSSATTSQLNLPLPYPLGYGTGPHDGKGVVDNKKPLPLSPSGIMAKLPLAWPIGYGTGPHDGPLELSTAEEKRLRQIIPYPIGTSNGRKTTDPLVLSPKEEREILNVLPEPVGTGDDGTALGLSSDQVHQIRMQFDSAIKAAKKYLNQENSAVQGDSGKSSKDSNKPVVGQYKSPGDSSF